MISDVKTFRSIEYVDLEGDVVIFHKFMDDSQATELINQLIHLGAKNIKIYILNHSEPESKLLD